MRRIPVSPMEEETIRRLEEQGLYFGQYLEIPELLTPREEIEEEYQEEE
jgi:hypothetical protein